MENIRQQILNILAGETPDKPLFLPRLDIWYNANKSRGSLPSGFENCTLKEVTEKLGLGMHAIIPDFLSSGNAEDIYHRGLGFYNHLDFPYYLDFSNIDFEVEQKSGKLTTTYITDNGEISTTISYNVDGNSSGASIPDIIEPAIKGRLDYLKLAEILGKVKVIKRPEQYASFRRLIGEAGIAAAYTSLAASPLHHIMRDLQKVDKFFLDMIDYSNEVETLCEALAPLYNSIIDSAVKSEAEVVLAGANYDDTITYPPLFEKYIMPHLLNTAERLHGADKYLLTHTDGENRLLLPYLKNSDIDIADSVCPAPMTKVNLKKYREVFGTKTTIWGGIPSTIMLNTCFDINTFKKYIKETLRACKPYNNIIFSVADTMPPDADFDRIQYLVDIFR